MPVLIGEPAPARLADAIRDAEQGLRRRLAEADQNVGIGKLDLPLDERQADLRSRAASACGFPAAATARCWRYRRRCGRSRSRASIRSSNLPDRPTKGQALDVLVRPGASPTNISARFAGCRRRRRAAWRSCAARSPRSRSGWRANPQARPPSAAASRAAITASSGGGGAAATGGSGTCCRSAAAPRCRHADRIAPPARRPAPARAKRLTGASPSAASTPASDIEGSRSRAALSFPGVIGHFYHDRHGPDCDFSPNVEKRNSNRGTAMSGDDRHR